MGHYKDEHGCDALTSVVASTGVALAGISSSNHIKETELTQRLSQAEAASSGGEDSNRVPPAALRQLVWRYHKGEREHKDTKASTCADT